MILFWRSSLTKVLVLLILLWVPEVSSAGGGTRACGKRLIKQVLRICNNCIGGSFMEQVKKRSESMPEPTLDLIHHYFPWIKTYRKKRGIVEECCMSQCSFRTLKKYCCKPSNNNDLKRSAPALFGYDYYDG